MQYYRLRYDWEIGSQYGGQLRAVAPCPGILNFQQLQHNPMSDEWARFWFSLNRTDDLKFDIQKWNSYTNGHAFLTDGNGTDTCRNIIAGENLDKSLPRIESKGCVGNVVCVDVKKTIRIRGVVHVKIETLDITKPPPWGMTYATHPHLIHHATNITKGRQCNPFSHLGGRSTHRPVYFPVTSKGAVYYPLKYLQRLTPGAPLPNPYFPKMEF